MRNDRTFYNTILSQAGFLILARVCHIDDGIAYGELEIIADIRVEAHDTYCSLAFLSLIVQAHGLGPAALKMTLAYCEQFVCLYTTIVKIAFPLNIDLLSSTFYLL